MHFEIDPRLVEDVVFLEAHRREAAGDGALALAVHAQADRLYEQAWPDNDARDLAFRDVHAAFFRDLGFERAITEVLAGYALLRAGLAQLSLLLALRRRDESAELFVRPEEGDPARPHRTAVVHVRAETVLDADRLRSWLRRELHHVQDMVDPAFGYRPSLGEVGDSPGRADLVRDRYRVLWDAWIDARLGGEQAAAIAGEMARAFRGLSDETREEVRRTVYDARAMTHARLLDLAGTGLAAASPGEAQATVEVPGAQSAPRA